MSLQRIIERHWQQPNLLLTILLYGFSRLFQAAVSLRRRLYLSGCLKSEKLPLPVVVVGNLHSGGTGKTPVTAALVRELRRQGVAAGIVSRGYGRRSGDVHVLNDNSSAAEAGDEPLMLYRQTGAPVAVGTDRAAAARALIAAHPELTLLVCDDGLQHYRLARDLEIVVYPAADAGRRPDLLPNGSLREPLSGWPPPMRCCFPTAMPIPPAAPKNFSGCLKHVFTAAPKPAALIVSAAPPKPCRPPTSPQARAAPPPLPSPAPSAFLRNWNGRAFVWTPPPPCPTTPPSTRPNCLQPTTFSSPKKTRSNCRPQPPAISGYCRFVR